MWSKQRTIQPGGTTQREEYIDPGLDKEPEAANVYPTTQTEGVIRGGLDTRTETNYSPGGSHMFHRSYKRNKTHVDINPYKSSDIEENEVKHKAPDETIMPAKEEMFEPEALTLEGQTVQAGNETKPLGCNICGKRFTSNLALEGHMQIHVNPEAIHDCNICHKEFGQLLNLTEHVYIHEKGGNLKSTHCQKDFTEPNRISKHIGQIHAKQMFYCIDRP